MDLFRIHACAPLVHLIRNEQVPQEKPREYGNAPINSNVFDRIEKLEQARAILTHPNFKKLNPEQAQDIYRALIASGVTRGEIVSILKSTM